MASHEAYRASRREPRTRILPWPFPSGKPWTSCYLSLRGEPLPGGAGKCRGCRKRFGKAPFRSRHRRMRPPGPDVARLGGSRARPRPFPRDSEPAERSDPLALRSPRRSPHALGEPRSRRLSRPDLEGDQEGEGRSPPRGTRTSSGQGRHAASGPQEDAALAFPLVGKPALAPASANRERQGLAAARDVPRGRAQEARLGLNAPPDRINSRRSFRLAGERIARVCASSISEPWLRR